MSDYMIFDYYIRRTDGLFYRGSVHGDDRDWTTDSNHADRAFGYTKAGAHKRLATFHDFFAGCVVVTKVS